MNLYLDDIRTPPEGRDWIIVRDDNAFKTALKDICPNFISWDHDLGDTSLNGYELAHWLVNKDINLGGTFIPTGFTYYVHSMNPVGKKNIISLLDNYLSRR